MSLPFVSPAFLASTLSKVVTEVANVKFPNMGGGTYLADVGKAFAAVAQNSANPERVTKEFNGMAANAPGMQFSDAEELPKSSGVYTALNKSTDSQIG